MGTGGRNLGRVIPPVSFLWRWRLPQRVTRPGGSAVAEQPLFCFPVNWRSLGGGNGGHRPPLQNGCPEPGAHPSNTSRGGRRSSATAAAFRFLGDEGYAGVDAFLDLFALQMVTIVITPVTHFQIGDCKTSACTPPCRDQPTDWVPASKRRLHIGRPEANVAERLGHWTGRVRTAADPVDFAAETVENVCAA